jgi:D-alanyl-lipoteichoic acid acyltransferase DltB (MBOAT superfamily)/acyl carrier protein
VSGPGVRTLAVAAQLALATWIVYRYQLESRGFLHLLILTCGGFVVHAALPARLRLGFFLALSLAGIVLVLGWGNAGILVGLGLALVGLCHLPVSWSARVGLLVLVGAALAWARARGLGPEAVWPILASMFMFRLIGYVHDLRHSQRQLSWRWSLSYFFLLPNVCFPLFPVVDFKKLRAGYFDEDAPEIYQRGVEWMLRGILHLLLYRVAYRFPTIDPLAVEGAGDLLRHLFTAFPLYLQVSGTFHLAVGMLLLFGFDLPATHDRYFLASSLTDFWRRINIYWKDFVLRIVFYPVHDRVRRLGATPALVAATLAVFVASWGLHAYQTFWLTGSAFWAWNDFLFWMVLGAGMVVNVIREDRRRGRPAAGLPRWLRIAAVFVSINVLWSMWTADSLGQWLGLWSAAPWLAGGLPALVGFLVTASFLVERRQAPRRRLPEPRRPRPFRFRAASTAAGLVAILVLGSPAVHGRLGSGPAEIVEASKASRLNQRDARVLARGYYERLTPAGLRNPALRELYTGRPDDWLRLDETAIWRPLDDFLGGELVPSRRIRFKGAELSTNRWGLRGAEIDRAKPAGTARVAFLGSSHTMGSGVGDEETFASLYEDRLHGGGRRYEVLSFAVAGYSALQDLYQLERKGLDFDPDAVVEVGHTHDVDKAVRYLASVLHDRRPIPYRELGDLLDRAGARSGDARVVVERRLRPHRWEVLAWAYGAIVERCRRAGVAPVFVFLPLLEGDRRADVDRLLAIAAEAGFHVVDLGDVYAGHDVAELRLAPWDLHPNALTHRLIADRLVHRLGLESLDRLMDDRPMTSIRETVRSFILREYLPGASPAELADDTELLRSGIVSSIARLRLRAFLEDEFDVELAGHELDAEHFGTVERIARLVRSKLEDTGWTSP